LLIDLGEAHPESAAKLTALYLVARDQPLDARARGQLGMAYEINGFRDAAKTTYAQAADLAPDDPRWTYLAALLLAADGEVEQALDAMDRSLAIDDLYVPGHLYRSQWLLDTGDAQAAEQGYREVLRLDPDNRSARLGVARALIRQQRSAEAVELLEAYGEGRPNDAYAQQLLGTAHRELGNLEAANAALARGRTDAAPSRWPDPRAEEKLRFVSGYGADMLHGERLLEAGRTDEAITVFEALFTERSEDLQLINNLAVAYRRAGQTERALDLLLESVESHPDYFPFFMNLGAVYQDAGQTEQALGAFERASELNPTLAQAHRRRARLLTELGRRQEALDAFETAISYEPTDRIAITYAGMLATELGQYERAVGWLEKSVELEPRMLPTLLALGECKAYLGDFEGADEALERAAALQPDSKSLVEIRSRVDELRTRGS
ncbi:MAG TPA: tetratricopeptide repeat protein, partial [Candidatus Polarisedimenticolaceae bacterium]|nr:tetratricopeptide repeat protein [Candidatus Polarisedimenticolaceae bacterium]